MNRPNILDKEYQDFNKSGMSSDEIDSVIYSSYCKDLEKYCDTLETALDLAVSDMNELDIDFVEQIAEPNSNVELLNDLIDEFGWVSGMVEYYKQYDEWKGFEKR